MADVKRILVGQSGGPTAAINSSLAGVVAGAREAGVEVIGMRHGIQGFLAGQTVDLAAALPDDAAIELLRHTPSSWLGSCRFKLPALDAAGTEAFYTDAFAKFEAAGMDAVLYIGGNDSMDTIAKLGAWGARVDSPIRFIGVPKTIDNDLVGIDHTPGYGSAAKFVATATSELMLDADVYDLKNVLFVEIMGRDAGWLAGSACLAEPDLVLLPEVTFNEDALVERVGELLERQNTVVIAMSEGLREADGHLIAEKTVAAGTKVDEFGHLAQLSGPSRYLASLVGGRLGVKTRAVELSTLQRCASHLASKVDLDEAFELGRIGVRAAMAGESVKMCSLTRTSSDPYSVEYALVDVLEVANQVKAVPREWICEDGLNVTEALRAYVEPLVDGLPEHLAAL
ncbi:diphosphate--fructose-6-phosphate 1-phosphotransferase [Paratractidigestivibacter sp.]|uniref:diphosphate--fructose-6-phosphate 1-phosphotransferase n=1 Tax=Paratractidigestivibacter sp. TaxID=2847316 RepID=UPI002ACB151B|nr:diphosphate--fructose-6-phosphate 1-phosphotransferase [Paratractidigestivibacter sp.]